MRGGASIGIPIVLGILSISVGAILSHWAHHTHADRTDPAPPSHEGIANEPSDETVASPLPRPTLDEILASSDTLQFRLVARFTEAANAEESRALLEGLSSQQKVGNGEMEPVVFVFSEARTGALGRFGASKGVVRLAHQR